MRTLLAESEVCQQDSVPPPAPSHDTPATHFNLFDEQAAAAEPVRRKPSPPLLDTETTTLSTKQGRLDIKVLRGFNVGRTGLILRSKSIGFRIMRPETAMDPDVRFEIRRNREGKAAAMLTWRQKFDVF